MHTNKDMDTQRQQTNPMAKGVEYTELGIPVTEYSGSRQGEFLLRVYDQMLCTAEINFFKRPVIQTYDNHRNKTGWMAVPTLEDLKNALYESVSIAQDLGLPDKVINMQDLETASYRSDFPRALESFQNLASQMVAMVTSNFNSYKNECRRSAGTTKILDIDHTTELSLDNFFRKYYDGV